MAAKKRILAIDDEASVGEMYEQCLPPLGYDVTCAANAQKAKDLLKKFIPDLILMDIMMPDQDGISLTREILSDDKTAHVPIIVVSGLSDSGTLHDAISFGAVDYVVKPIDVDILTGKKERALAMAERKKKQKT
ncbi:MAG: response regulator [Elusimicrobia bacterium]|nr:response regulator [Elusimicrobiota bacterium]